MGDGKHCPSCGKDIGKWPVFSAMWPSLIWCPHCKSRLRYRNTASVVAVLFAVGILIALVAFAIVSSLSIRSPIRTWAAIVLISWVPVELALTWFLRNRRELELANQS
jgi:uncharacterized protein (DUF983 family)